MQIPCERCGKKFDTLPCFVKRGKKFCSRKCQYDVPKTTVRCKVCGVDFRVLPYRAKIAVACSGKCRGIIVGQKNKGKHYAGHPAWNKGMKGLYLAPGSGIKAGSVPWNKGVKGLHLSPATEFKPGRHEKSRVPVGTIRSRPDKQGNQRNHIKVAEGKWDHLSRFLWERENGPIPEGMLIHHVNHISNDDRLENYAMLTRAEHARIHKLVLH